MASKIFTPEGFIMLFVAGIFDFLGYVCLILVVAAGIGALFGRIVSVTGLVVIAIWRLARGGKTKKEAGAEVLEEEIKAMEEEKEAREKRKAKRDATAASGGKGSKAIAKMGDAKDKIKEMVSMSAFLKKHWKKLLVEAVPILGDIYPAFIMTVYSELK